MILYFCTIRIGQGRIFIQVIICRNSPVEKKLNSVCFAEGKCKYENRFTVSM